MIGHLRGLLLEKNAPHLLLEVNGIGYEIEVSTHTFHQLAMPGEIVSLHIHFVVREDAQLLYGFIDRQEKSLFRSLIKINNVGPKLAMAILSGISPAHFVRCVIDNDTTTLTRLPGVGKKTAERLIVEMKDRLADWTSQEPLHCDTTNVAGSERAQIQALSSDRSDALQALIALGYKLPEANRAINKITGEQLSSADMVRLALQHI